MNLRTRRAVGLSALASSLLLAAHAAHPADALREMHGSADAFAAPGMALAWGVLRGADEARTVVVVRIAVDPTLYGDVTVTGSDPFSAQKDAMPAVPKGGGVVDVRVPRAHFAAFPRTDLQFHAPAPNASLRVYYLGVPDTTPEFNDEDKLDAYLRQRIVQVRGSKPP